MYYKLYITYDKNVIIRSDRDCFQLEGTGETFELNQKSWIRFIYTDIRDKVFPGKGDQQEQRQEGSELWRLHGALQENNGGQTGKEAQDS